MTKTAPSSSHPPCGAASGAAGFSLVEVLIAAALILFITLGVLPMFAQAIASNLSGQDSTEAANAARSRLEEFLQLPFDSNRLEIVNGTEREIQEYYSSEDRRWVEGELADVPADDSALWTRRTLIRQYQSTDLTLPLEAGAPPETIHLKEIQVRVASTRTGGPLGGGTRFSTRVFKAR